MRSVAVCLLITIPLVTLIAAPVRPANQEEQRKKAPPLSLDGFLDEALPEAPQEGKAMQVDNESCYVCHANYKEEELVVAHGREGVSCIDCHGKSEDHRNDEDNITPPDKMFALVGIDDMCIDCHETHDVSARDVLERWKQRCPDKSDPESVFCTDCHFQHRLAFRTVWWNKKTGELIVRKEGQRIKQREAVAVPDN